MRVAVGGTAFRPSGITEAALVTATRKEKEAEAAEIEAQKELNKAQSALESATAARIAAKARTDRWLNKAADGKREVAPAKKARRDPCSANPINKEKKAEQAEIEAQKKRQAAQSALESATAARTAAAAMTDVLLKEAEEAEAAATEAAEAQIWFDMVIRQLGL